MSFVFTVSSFCTSAPEEREEKPRNRAFGYVAKSDAPQGQRRRRLPVAIPSRKKPSCRARPKSPREVLAKEMIPSCARKSERRLAGGGGKSRSERKPSSRDRKWGRVLAGGKRGRKAIGHTWGGRKASRSGSHARLSGISRTTGRRSNPLHRLQEDSHRPTCPRTMVNLGVPLPQQVRCRGAHRANNARLAERAQA